MKYLLIISCLFLFSPELPGIDKQSFNLIEPPKVESRPVENIPSDWRKVDRVDVETPSQWYRCPINSLEWRYISPGYIQIRQPSNVWDRIDINSIRISSGNC